MFCHVNATVGSLTACEITAAESTPTDCAQDSPTARKHSVCEGHSDLQRCWTQTQTDGETLLLCLTAILHKK